MKLRELKNIIRKEVKKLKEQANKKTKINAAQLWKMLGSPKTAGQFKNAYTQWYNQNQQHIISGANSPQQVSRLMSQKGISDQEDTTKGIPVWVGYVAVRGAIFLGTAAIGYGISLLENRNMGKAPTQAQIMGAYKKMGSPPTLRAIGRELKRHKVPPKSVDAVINQAALDYGVGMDDNIQALPPLIAAVLGAKTTWAILGGAVGYGIGWFYGGSTI